MLPRCKQEAITITQGNDASAINNKRGMAKRAKRQASKKSRQAIDVELLPMMWLSIGPDGMRLEPIDTPT